MEEEGQWELHKENVLPLARGRDISKIEAVLSTKKTGLSHSWISELDHKRETFECQIEKYEGEDPLKPWLSYVKWAQEEFVTDQSEAFRVLERCSRQFVDHPGYTQDMRYLKIWIAYANLLSNPSDLFKYLHKNGIGTTHSLFWIAWALVTEKQGNYTLTEKIITKGIKCGASPVEHMVKRHREFIRRMSRLWINVHIGEDELGARGTVETPFNSRNVDNAEEERKALEDLSRRSMGPRGQARASARSTRQQSSERSQVNPSTLLQGVTTGGRSSRSSTSMVSGGPNNRGGFAIFVEEDFREGRPSRRVDQGYDLNDTGEGGWDHLPSKKEGSKENTVEAGRWNDQGFARDKGLPISSQPTVCHTSIPIFVEEQFQGDQEEAEVSEVSAHSLRKGLVQRDKPHPATDLEKLALDPLRNLKKQARVKEGKKSNETSNVSAKANSSTELNNSEKSVTVDKKGALPFGFNIEALNTSATPSVEELCFEELRMALYATCAAKSPCQSSNVDMDIQATMEVNLDPKTLRSCEDQNTSLHQSPEPRKICFANDNGTWSSGKPTELEKKVGFAQPDPCTPKGGFSRAGTPWKSGQQYDSPCVSEEGDTQMVRAARVETPGNACPDPLSETPWNPLISPDEKDDAQSGLLGGSPKNTHDEGMTINTKIALEELGSMFASPGAKFNAPQTKNVVKFDLTATSDQKNKRTSSTQLGPKPLSFPIFTDSQDGGENDKGSVEDVASNSFEDRQRSSRFACSGTGVDNPFGQQSQKPRAALQQRKVTNRDVISSFRGSKNAALTGEASDSNPTEESKCFDSNYGGSKEELGFQIFSDAEQQEVNHPTFEIFNDADNPKGTPGFQIFSDDLQEYERKPDLDKLEGTPGFQIFSDDLHENKRKAESDNLEGTPGFQIFSNDLHENKRKADSDNLEGTTGFQIFSDNLHENERKPDLDNLEGKEPSKPSVGFQIYDENVKQESVPKLVLQEKRKIGTELSVLNEEENSQENSFISMKPVKTPFTDFKVFGTTEQPSAIRRVDNSITTLTVDDFEDDSASFRINTNNSGSSNANSLYVSSSGSSILSAGESCSRRQASGSK